MNGYDAVRVICHVFMFVFLPTLSFAEIDANKNLYWDRMSNTFIACNSKPSAAKLSKVYDNPDAAARQFQINLLVADGECFDLRRSSVLLAYIKSDDNYEYWKMKVRENKIIDIYAVNLSGLSGADRTKQMTEKMLEYKNTEERKAAHEAVLKEKAEIAQINIKREEEKRIEDSERKLNALNDMNEQFKDYYIKEGVYQTSSNYESYLYYDLKLNKILDFDENGDLKVLVDMPTWESGWLSDRSSVNEIKIKTSDLISNTEYETSERVKKLKEIEKEFIGYHVYSNSAFDTNYNQIDNLYKYGLLKSDYKKVLDNKKIYEVVKVHDFYKGYAYVEVNITMLKDRNYKENERFWVDSNNIKKPITLKDIKNWFSS